MDYVRVPPSGPIFACGFACCRSVWGLADNCNKAFDSMTDAKGSQMVKFMNFDIAKLTVFSLNTAHTDEHYGNMVTYLRIKGIVPPTSENPPGQAPK